MNLTKSSDDLVKRETNCNDFFLKIEINSITNFNKCWLNDMVKSVNLNFVSY